MRMRKETTYDGVWTVFVDDGLCFSDLSEPAADALMAAFARLRAGGA